MKESYYKINESIYSRTDLNIYEKQIYALTKNFGIVHLTNPQLQIMLSTNETRITRTVRSLVEKKLITTEKQSNGKRVIKLPDPVVNMTTGNYPVVTVTDPVVTVTDPVVTVTDPVVTVTTPSNSKTNKQVSDSDLKKEKEINKEKEKIGAGTGPTDIEKAQQELKNMYKDCYLIIRDPTIKKLLPTLEEYNLLVESKNKSKLNQIHIEFFNGSKKKYLKNLVELL